MNITLHAATYYIFTEGNWQ